MGLCHTAIVEACAGIICELGTKIYGLGLDETC